MSNQPTPRRFRFSLRTLFVLVTLLSIPLVWIGYGMNWSRQRKAFLESHQWAVIDRTPSGKPEVRQPPWTLFILGETPVGCLYLSPTEEIDEVRRLFPEAEIVLK